MTCLRTTETANPTLKVSPSVLVSEMKKATGRSGGPLLPLRQLD
jgi:hypothetical protein